MGVTPELPGVGREGYRFSWRGGGIGKELYLYFYSREIPLFSDLETCHDYIRTLYSGPFFLSLGLLS